MPAKASDIIYDHVFKQLCAEGYRSEHAAQAGSAAIRKHRRNQTANKAIKDAIAECKKAHKKVK